ncbi:hypothetical protein [Aminobacter phage Erebus]|nr:hypothetical protein [Aminobacter phage Erebus]
MNFWEWFASEKGELLTAATAGGIVSAAMDWTGFLPAVRKIVVGTISAYYLSPLAIPYVGWALDGISVPQDKALGMSGFIMGVLGIVVIDTIMRAAQIKLAGLNKATEADTDSNGG